METKEVQRNRKIGRICELVERWDGASFKDIKGVGDVLIKRVFYKNVYDHEGTEIFVNEKKVSWDYFSFEQLEEMVEIVLDNNLGITY